MEEVWFSADDERLGIVFQSGMVLFMWPSPYEDPKASFAAMIAHGGAEMYLTTVRGHDALAIEPDTDIEGANPAWIDFVEDGVLVSVWSYEHSLAEVMDVAETLEPAPAET